MGKVVVEFTSAEARLFKAQQKLIAQEVKMQTGYDRVQKSARKAGDTGAAGARKAESSTSKLAGTVKSLATSYFGAQAALAIFNQALAEQNRLQGEAKDTKLTVGQSQAAVIKNLGLGVGKDEANAFLKQIEGVQKRSGFESVAPLNQAASSILSATAGNKGQTLEILDKAAVFFKDAPDDLAEFGGALGDAMKVTGSKDAKETLALLLAVQGQARFTGLSGFKQVAPALASGKIATTGSTDRIKSTRETAALFASIGSQIGDPDAAVTKTAVINLEKNLATLVPQFETTFERLAHVQADKSGKLAAEVTKSGFKGQTVLAVKQLLSGADTEAGRGLQAAFGKIVGSVEATDKMAAVLRGGTSELRTVDRDARGKGLLEASRTRSAGALRDEVADIVIGTLGQIDYGGATPIESFMQRGARRIGLGISGNDPETGIAVLANSLQGMQDVTADRTLKEINDQNALILSQIKILEEIRDELNAGRLTPSKRRNAQQAQQNATALSTE